MIKIFRISLILYFTMFISLSSSAQIGVGFEVNAWNKKEFLAAFYNVENLFDTINDPLTNDDEFTPLSTKKWGRDRYNEKVSQLAKVISEMGQNRSMLLGLCEIENINVLRDLSNRDELRPYVFGIVHFESPDERGIDVALLYPKEQMVVLRKEALNVPMPEGERPTRDILYAQLRFRKYGVLHVFVNHWPSRTGGAEITEYKRIAAAEVLKEKIDEILMTDPDAYVICMGDFNDYPTDKSLIETLGARSKDEDEILVNLMQGLESEKRGSYNYKGDWGFLDQIIVSRPFFDGKGLDLIKGSTSPYFSADMIHKNDKNAESPNRTYSGDRYYGGYSDHLPVYTRIKIQK